MHPWKCQLNPCETSDFKIVQEVTTWGTNLLLPAVVPALVLGAVAHCFTDCKPRPGQACLWRPTATSGHRSTMTGVEGCEMETSEDEKISERQDITPEQKRMLDIWVDEQARIREKIVMSDAMSFSPEAWEGLQFIGGVDISFVKDSADEACASLIILEFPSMQVVYECSRPVRMTLPYISGFLAFRECPFLVELLEEMCHALVLHDVVFRIQTVKSRHAELYPQVVLVDGNGVLHPRGCGLASHLGVVAGVPTVGVAKKFMHVDGVTKTEIAAKINTTLSDEVDRFDIVGQSGVVWGAALQGGKGSKNPIFVSVGHMISLDTAVRLVAACCTTRVPEPIRQADLRSREFLCPTGRQLKTPTYADT